MVNKGCNKQSNDFLHFLPNKNYEKLLYSEF